MNELYIDAGMLYFRTNNAKAEGAFDELMAICDTCGIELYCSDCTLRDSEGNDIDKYHID